MMNPIHSYRKVHGQCAILYHLQLFESNYSSRSISVYTFSIRTIGWRTNSAETQLCYRGGEVCLNGDRPWIDLIWDFLTTNNIDFRLTVSEDGKKALIALSGGDMRRVINVLQSTWMAYGNVTEDNVYTCVGHPQKIDIQNIVGWLLSLESFQETYDSKKNQIYLPIEKKMNRKFIRSLTRFRNPRVEIE